MLRTTNFLRLFTVPLRVRAAQPAPPLTVAKRYLETQASSPSSEPAQTTASHEQSPPAAASLPPSPGAATVASKATARPHAAKTLQRQHWPALPYRVYRTPSNEFAVYQLAKRGGNKKLTNIKKVEGNKDRFRAALAQDLGLEEKSVIINNLTGHIVVPGHRRTEVKEWLEKQGF